MSNNIVISTKSVLLFLLTVAVGWLLYQIRGVLLIVYISLILALTLNPLVSKVQSKVKRRGVAVMLVMLSVVILFGIILSFGLSPIISQTGSFISGFPNLLQSTFDYLGYGHLTETAVRSLTGSLANSSGGVVTVTLGIFSNAIAVFSIVIFTAYILIDFEKLKRSFLSFFIGHKRRQMEEIFDDVEIRLGSWLRGQAFLMLVVGLLSFIGLSLLGVRYAVPLAFLAGLLEIIPNLGPTLAALPAVLVALSSSPLLALGTLALYILIQQLENNFIVPKVMERVLGFNPLVTILAILIGGKLLGILGGILALPTLLLAVIVISHLTGRDISL